MKQITAALLLLLAPAPALAYEHPCAALYPQGAMAVYACLVQNGDAQIPAPTTEPYPTGDDVRPLTGPGGYWPKECTPCGGMNTLSPATANHCVPIEQFSADVCNSMLTYKGDQVQAPAAEVFHSDGDPWQWHYVAAKKHAEGMEARALEAEAALAAARAKCGRRCR